MRLDEVLTSKEAVISPARGNYGLHDIVKAYEFEVDGSLYLCYLDSCAGPGKPNTLGFMKVADRRGSHKITGDNVPFKVLSSVMRCVRLFIQDLHPLSIYINGFSPKQHRLYVKMVKHFSNLIPKPYFVAFRKDGALFISRDENLADNEGTTFSPEYNDNMTPVKHDDALGGNPQRPLKGSLAGIRI